MSDRTTKQKIAAKRNFSKFRLKGMLTGLNSINVVISEEESLHILRAHLTELLKNWDDNTRKVLKQNSDL